MGRDLLHRPQVPLPLDDEASGPVKKKADKLGVKSRARDLGGVSDPKIATPTPRAKAEESKAPKAFKAAYFNNDSSGVKQANFGASKMAALRGQEGAADLRKIVIPPSKLGIESPDPKVLNNASGLMGLEAEFNEGLEGLLGRQNNYLKQPGVTVESIEALKAELENQVELRKKALARMGARAQNNPTTALAQEAKGQALEGVDDVVAAGAERISNSKTHADGMHARVAKTLGIKRKKST